MARRIYVSEGLVFRSKSLESLRHRPSHAAASLEGVFPKSAGFALHTRGEEVYNFPLPLALSSIG